MNSVYVDISQKNKIRAEAVRASIRRHTDNADHSLLINRDASDQHPVSSITGLEAALDCLKEMSGKAGEDGKSAYEIALDNGFVGTEKEWLESLHGENADPLPDSLPNPHSLRFTGAVTAEYDGSRAVNINVPASEVSIGAREPTGNETVWIDTSVPGIVIDPEPLANSSNLITSGAVHSALSRKADSTHNHNYAGSSSSGGSAQSAEKLDSSAGSATQPVYFSNGKPVATTYSLNKTVPSDAIFTDTKYTHPNYTARTGVPASNQTPAFGGTFSVSQPVSDSSGHVTAMNSRQVKIPNSVATASAAGLMSAGDYAKLLSYPDRSGNTFYFNSTGFSAGNSITVDKAWRNFTLFVVTFAGQATTVLAVKYNGYLRGLGGMAGGTTSNTTLALACTYAEGTDNDTITCVQATSMNHATGSTAHSMVSSALAISSIIGLI